MKPTQTPGGWKKAAADFHRRHGKKLFTMTWNSTIEAEMQDKGLAKETRLLAAIRRYSWGNLSDYAVDGLPPKRATDPKPKPLTQIQLGEMLGLRPASVSEGISYLKERGYLRQDHQFLYPEDDVNLLESEKNRQSNSNCTNSTSPYLRFEQEFFENQPPLKKRLTDLDQERKKKMEEAKNATSEIHKIKMLALVEWKRLERSGDSLRYCAPAQDEREYKANSTSEYTTNNGSNCQAESFATAEADFDPSRTRPAVTPIDSIAESDGPLKPLNSKRITAGGTTTTLPNSKNSSSSSPPPIQPLPIPAEFVNRLPQGFTAAGKPTPTRAQIAAAYIQVGPRWEEFLDWLPLSDEFRRMTHPGGLPTLIGFFLESEPGQQPQRRPMTPAEASREKVLAGLDAIDRMKGRIAR